VGGSILVAIFNGGPPGVIYEFCAVSIFYWMVAASLAELASAIPSSAGVYHWASVTPGKKWGRIVGYGRRLDCVGGPLTFNSAFMLAIGIGWHGCSVQHQ
jgi:amino acid transporter